MTNPPADIFVSLVIPCYNESERLSITFEALQEFDVKWPHRYEVILVNDGSKDDTATKIEANEIFQKLAVNNQAFFVNNSANNGKGYALKKGVAAAHGKSILTLDADISAHPLLLLDWLALRPDLFSSPEIFIASRQHPDSKINALSSRKSMGFVFNTLVQWFTPLQLTDTQCGFKLYPAALAKTIFSNLQINGWAHDVEILSQAYEAGVPITEMPLTWQNVDDSKINLLTDPPKMILEILKVRNILKKKRSIPLPVTST